MKRIAALVLLFASAASAQTVFPVISEYGKKANGSFQLENNTLLPLAVTIEAYNFSVDKTGKHMRKLDSTTHIQLSETSMRMGPKETREISYRLKCDVLPCEVSILSGMVVGHTQGDKDHPVMQVRLILDHTIYLCAKAKGCRSGIISASGYQGPLTPQPTEAKVSSPAK